MILLLTQCFPPDAGGIEALMGGLAGAIAATGEEVTVLADRIRTRGAAEAVPPGIALRRFGGPKPLRRLAKALAVRRLLARAAPRAVIVDTWKSAALLPARPAVPVLVLAHGNEVLPVGSARRAARRRRAFARATAVAAASAYTEALVRDLLGPGDGPLVAVVPPPLPVPADATPEAVARIAAVLPGASPLIASLARLEPRKGIDQVIRALPALARRHPGIALLVAGSGPDRERLAALAQEQGVAPRVAFLGRVDEAEKAALLARADLFAMPARREGASVEGFGIVYLEAAWQGRASLAGREGGAAEAVADGRTGMLCDGADEAAVAAALAALLEDPARLQAMGAAAAERVRAGFLWPQVLPRYLGLLGV